MISGEAIDQPVVARSKRLKHAREQRIRETRRERAFGLVTTYQTLHHSLGTHLLENGVDMRYMQESLGHGRIKITEGYAHVSESALGRIKSPLEK